MSRLAMKRLLLATAFACIAGAMPAEAAEFRVTKGYGFDGLPTLYLEGDIEPGDFDKFALCREPDQRCARWFI
jgi:hypothetical protein